MLAIRTKLIELVREICRFSSTLSITRNSEVHKRKSSDLRRRNKWCQLKKHFCNVLSSPKRMPSRYNSEYCINNDGRVGSSVIHLSLMNDINIFCRDREGDTVFVIIVLVSDLPEKQQQQQTVLWELIKTEIQYIKMLTVVTDVS